VLKIGLTMLKLVLFLTVLVNISAKIVEDVRDRLNTKSVINVNSKRPQIDVKSIHNVVKTIGKEVKRETIRIEDTYLDGFLLTNFYEEDCNSKLTIQDGVKANTCLTSISGGSYFYQCDTGKF
jgi:uncharacterized membrane protein YhiD involved in acid resistance